MKKFICLFIILLLVVTNGYTGTTGKIAGTIHDKATGEPLILANIVVSAQWVDGEEVILTTPFGAASNENGEYFILKVPPGVYSVAGNYIGYKKEIKTQVKVSIDRTSLVNFSLEPKLLTGEEVVVTAYRGLKIEVDQTSSKQSYTISDITDIAGVNNIEDIIELQADVVDNHFRGGRIGESSYLINGASIVNPINNQSSFKPLTPALQEVEVFTSGFSAEYGNAQSGVINMVTKEGGEKWATTLDISSTLPGYKTWGGSFYSLENMPFYDLLKNPEEWLNNYNPSEPGTNLKNFEQYIPVNATRADSLRAATLARDNYLQMVRDIGLEYENSIDRRLDFTVGGPVSDKLKLFTAVRYEITNPIAPVPHPNTTKQMMSNLSYQFDSNNKIKFGYSYSDIFKNDLNSGAFLDWSFDREMRVPKETEKVNQFMVSWNYMFNPATFMQFDIDYLLTESRYRPEFLLPDRYRKEDSLAAYNRNYADWYINTPSGHRVGEVYTERREHEKSKTLNIKGTVTSQVTTNNLLKSGLQFSYYDLWIKNGRDFNTIPESQLETYSVYPFEGALYVQDKMEFEGMIANLGLRFDFYNFNYTYFSDIYAPLRNQYFDPDDPNSGPEYSRELAARETTKLFSKLQPRVGLSFPVTETSVIYLNYGMFVQRPQFNRILKTQITGVGQVMELGNPRLKPEETTAYDVGLVQGLPLDFKLEVSAYYKDVQNLIQQAIYYDRGFIPYYTFTNLDYANIKGFHINLEKNAGLWSSIIRYNYQDATGKSSTPFDNPIGYYEVALEGQGTIDLPDPEDINLDYNRKHRLVWNLRFKSPKRFGPSLGSMYPLSNLSLSATYKVMSGRPYTWDPEGEGLRYNDTTPTETELNIRFQKRVSLGDYKTTFYLEGFNVLNEKHYCYYIYSNPQEIDQVKEEGAASTEFLSVDDISPYLTSRTVRVISNSPRIFRFGVLFSF